MQLYINSVVAKSSVYCLLFIIIIAFADTMATSWHCLSCRKKCLSAITLIYREHLNTSLLLKYKQKESQMSHVPF